MSGNSSHLHYQPTDDPQSEQLKLVGLPLEVRRLIYKGLFAWYTPISNAPEPGPHACPSVDEKAMEMRGVLDLSIQLADKSMKLEFDQLNSKEYFLLFFLCLKKEENRRTKQDKKKIYILSIITGIIYYADGHGFWYSRTAPWNEWANGTKTNPTNNYPSPTPHPASPSGTVVRAGSGGIIYDNRYIINP